MADESKPDQESTPNPRRSRREPPVIEGEAKEIPSAEDQAKAEAPARAARLRARLAAFDWQTAAPYAGVALMAGILSGVIAGWMFSAPASPPTDISSLQREIATLANKIGAQKIDPALSARIERLETVTKQIPDVSPIADRNAKLEVALGELRGELAELKKAVESRAPAPTVSEIEAINRRLGAVDERLAVLAAPKPEPPKPVVVEAPRPAEVVALGALRDSVLSGASFARELDTVRALLKERAAELAPLEKYAADGLPTVAALAKRFEPIASQLVRAPEPEGGFFTRLWSNAGKLVEVRPAGEPKGNDAGSVVARMESKLSRGDLSGALEESKLLPAASKTNASEWFELAERRRDAESLVKNLLNAALAAISAERIKQ